MTFSTQWTDCSDDHSSIGPGASTLERATSTPELVEATQALCALNDLEAADRS